MAYRYFLHLTANQAWVCGRLFGELALRAAAAGDTGIIRFDEAEPVDTFFITDYCNSVKQFVKVCRMVEKNTRDILFGTCTMTLTQGQAGTIINTVADIACMFRAHEQKRIWTFGAAQLLSKTGAITDIYEIEQQAYSMLDNNPLISRDAANGH